MYIIYLLLLVISYKFLNYNLNSKNKNKLIFIFCVIIVYTGTFAYYTDDYESYVQIIRDLNNNYFSFTHIEPIWIPIIVFFEGSIDLFRFFVMFLMLCSILGVSKLTKIDTFSYILFYILFCFSTHICWLRQPISMFAFLFSLLLLTQRKIFFAIGFIFLSYCFHKSSLLLIVLFPFCLIPIRRKTLIYSALFFPLLFKLFDYVINNQIIPGLNVQFYLEMQGEYSERNYLFGLFGLLSSILQFLLIVVTLKMAYKDSEPKFELLFRILYGVCILSFFFFILPIDNNVLYKRLLAFGMLAIIPIWCEHIKRKMFKNKYRMLLFLMISFIIIRELLVLGKHITDLNVLLKL